jgi:tetratricopeptide (TPR) repeat protein
MGGMSSNCDVLLRGELAMGTLTMRGDSGRVWRCAVALAALLTLATAPISGQTLKGRLQADARDGGLEELDFLSAALIASGTDDPSELAGWLAGYHQRRAQLLARVRAGSPRERLEAIQAGLHERVLTGDYRMAATDLRVALADGDFNCLSSVALYFDVCQAVGIEVEICLASGHVFLRHCSDGRELTIEPGSWQWNRPDKRRPGRARKITPVELVGKFYYNRGVELVQARKFAAGIELLETSLELDPQDRDGRANLAAGLNNWAVEMFRGNRYIEAATLIEQGLLVDAEFAPLVANKKLVRAKLGQ